MARAATTADAFNAVAEPRRRQILDLLASGERPVNDLVAELGVPPAAGVEAPARAARGRRGRGARGRATAPLSGERRGAETHPRLGGELRAHMVGAIRPARCRTGRTQAEGGRNGRDGSRKATVSLPSRRADPHHAGVRGSAGARVEGMDDAGARSAVAGHNGQEPDDCRRREPSDDAGRRDRRE